MKKINLSFHYGSRLTPARDWNRLLLAAALVLIASLAWNFWLFEDVVNGGVLGSEPASNAPAVASSTLNKIQGVFSTRNTEESKYVTGAYQFIDPSK